jgi:hypothetical protein
MLIDGDETGSSGGIFGIFNIKVLILFPRLPYFISFLSKPGFFSKGSGL